jgi:hypothetical protein
MKHAVSVSAFLTANLFAAFAHAESLARPLPEDGTWARYKFTIDFVDASGKSSPSAGTLTVRSVGRKKIDGRWYRWIERTKDFTEGEIKAKSTAKLLFDEKKLETGEPWADCLREAYDQVEADGSKYEIESLNINESVPRKLLQTMVGPFFPNNEDAKQLIEDVEIKSALGSLKCKGFTRKSDQKTLNGSMDEDIYTIRLHDKSPFGVVAWDFEGVRRNQGKIVHTTKHKYVLEKTGNDAKSEMPERK